MESFPYPDGDVAKLIFGIARECRKLVELCTGKVLFELRNGNRLKTENTQYFGQTMRALPTSVSALTGAVERWSARVAAVAGEHPQMAQLLSRVREVQVAVQRVVGGMADLVAEADPMRMITLQKGLPKLLGIVEAANEAFLVCFTNCRLAGLLVISPQQIQQTQQDLPQTTVMFNTIQPPPVCATPAEHSKIALLQRRDSRRSVNSTVLSKLERRTINPSARVPPVALGASQGASTCTSPHSSRKRSSMMTALGISFDDQQVGQQAGQPQRRMSSSTRTLGASVSPRSSLSPRRGASLSSGSPGMQPHAPPTTLQCVVAAVKESATAVDALVTAAVDANMDALGVSARQLTACLKDLVGIAQTMSLVTEEQNIKSAVTSLVRVAKEVFRTPSEENHHSLQLSRRMTRDAIAAILTPAKAQLNNKPCAATQPSPLPSDPLQASAVKIQRWFRALRSFRRRCTAWHNLLDLLKSEACRSFCKRGVKKHQLIKELLYTETRYVEDLKVLLKVYVEPLKDSKYLAVNEHAAIFSNIEGLVAMNAELLELLRARYDEWPAKSTFGDIFVAKKDLLQLYGRFVRNFRVSNEVIDQLTAKKTPFSQFLEEQRRETKALNAYLIMPVQRLPRYEMMLEQIFDLTDAEHEDKDHLRQAVKIVKETTEYIDRLTASRNKQVSLTKLINNCPSLIDEDRSYIREGIFLVVQKKDLRKTMRHHEKKPKIFHNFLFTDMLLVSVVERDITDAEKKGETFPKPGKGPYTYRFTVPLCKCFLYDCTVGYNAPTRFVVSVTADPRQPDDDFFLFFETLGQKQMWLTDLNSCTNNLYKKKELTYWS
mmetsp:Transcript_9885/g.24675  ORF Transcript_9885/g.24675 Transcript_9885/m.24675 type:complete len:830 (-) Transcript_9885:169-2658(-)